MCNYLTKKNIVMLASCIYMVSFTIMQDLHFSFEVSQSQLHLISGTQLCSVVASSEGFCSWTDYSRVHYIFSMENFANLPVYIEPSSHIELNNHLVIIFLVLRPSDSFVTSLLQQDSFSSSTCCPCDLIHLYRSSIFNKS